MTHVLLIEGDRNDARLLSNLLGHSPSQDLTLEWAPTINHGLARLARGEVDAVLLDLFLPDSKGLDTLYKVRQHAPGTAVLILTKINDEQLAIEAVRKGAQDYLVKGQVDGNLLVRAIHYAIERQRLLKQLEEARAAAQRLMLIDDLTGLYNRRGFFTLAEQQWKLARRRKKGMTLIFCDLDNMKAINDHLGHLAGDEALIQVAEVLRSTFRESDIIARMGGDEFAVLAIDTTPASHPVLAQRLDEAVARYNARAPQGMRLSLSYGMADFDPQNPEPLDVVLGRADAAMYRQKEQKKGLRPRNRPSPPAS